MSGMLERKNVVTGLPSEGREEVIRRCGAMLTAAGYVDGHYVEGMLERDKSFSTAIGNGIAIPHGAKEYKKDIHSTGLVVLTYPEGVEWNGEKVKLVIGIAAKGDEHIEILEQVVEAFEDEKAVEDVVAANDADALYAILAGNKS